MLLLQTNPNALRLLIPLCIGMALGGAFLGSLWITVQQLPRVHSPWLLYLVSFLLRVAVVVVAFHFLARQHWTWLVAGLLGFVLIRTLGVRWVTWRAAATADSAKDI